MSAHKKVVFFSIPGEDVQRIAKIDQFMADSLARGIIRGFSKGTGEILEVTQRGSREYPIIHYDVELLDGDGEAAQRFVNALFEKEFIPEGTIWQVLILRDLS